MANSGVLTYNPKNLLVLFGYQQIHGFSEDDMVTIAPNGDGSQIYVGADGEVGRSIDPNQTFEVTITLATSSTSNEYLSGMYNTDRVTGMGLVPLEIKDLSGQTLFKAEQAWVANMPEASYGRTIDSREWTLYTGQVTAPIIGGNN